MLFVSQFGTHCISKGSGRRLRCLLLLGAILHRLLRIELESHVLLAHSSFQVDLHFLDLLRVLAAQNELFGELDGSPIGTVTF